MSEPLTPQPSDLDPDVPPAAGHRPAHARQTPAPATCPECGGQEFAQEIAVLNGLHIGRAHSITMLVCQQCFFVKTFYGERQMAPENNKRVQ